MEAENNMEENQQQQQQEQQQNPQTVESQLQEQEHEILQPSETTGQMTPMESIGEAVGDALPIETDNSMNAEPLLPAEKFQETTTEAEPMDSIVAPLEATKEEETHEPSIGMTDDVPRVPENVAAQIDEVPVAVPSEPEPQAFQNQEDTSPTVNHNENPSFDDVDSSNLNSYLKRTMQNEAEEEEASPKKPKFNEDCMTASEQSSENPQDSLIPNSEAVESPQLLIASVEPHQPEKVENLDPMPQIENSQTDFSAIPAEESVHSSENSTETRNSPLNEVDFHQSQPSPPAPSRVPSMVVEKMIEKKPIEEPTPTTSVMYKEAMDIHEKLREMGEISVKPVLKGDQSGSSKKPDGENEISVEIKKKSGDKYESEDSKRITNLRKNIREVMDENQLDATTLAAQRQESERLARVQEQQKIIRELQRQMAAERQNNRTQSRVMSILQGQTSLLKNSNSERLSISGNASTDMYIVKGVASEVTFKGSGFVDVDKISSGNLTPSVSIAPVRRSTVKDVEEPPEEDSDTDKKEVVTIVDSSSDNDCIVLSDDDEIEEEPEDDPHNSGLHVNDAYNIPDEEGRVVINIGHPEGESDIFVAPQIARVMKPHQIGGVRFLYDNIIESTERFSTSTGFGCILAHSMGLGKTLQIVCFCDIFLRHTNSKSILCIMPINTLQNWVSEFNMWLPEDPDRCPLKAHGEIRTRNFKIFVLNDQYKTVNARARVILEWARNGGVLLIGYELFRLLSLKMTNKKKRGKKFVDKEVKVETDAQKRQMEDIHAALVKPGPDLVICDEGHRIKNSHASISVALKQIRSKRRIVLTGYPLQNNLLEYWCMVDFVRPNYLGTKTEFANMFERPIQNGQCIDSTPQDIKLMRYRAHVLHSLLVGFVQRRSHVVLQNSLPQKEEYVILVKMTAFQRKLYEVFMNEVVRTKAVPNPLKAFAVCCKIWNHPDVLYQFLKKREADLDLEIEEVEGDSSSTSTSTSTASSVKGKGKKPAATKKTKEINKDGKTIPSVEVPPNQSKGPSGATTAATTTTTTNTATTMSPTATTAASSGSSSSTVTTPALGNKSPKKEDIKPQVANIISPPEGIPPPSSMQYESGNFLPYNSYGYDGYYNSYGSMYQQPGYGNQNYNSFGHSNTNNYWQGNSNYYPYGTHQSGGDGYNQDELSYPHIGSIKSEQNDSPLTDKKSSEIVDLDTKEITTVETNIDSIPFCDVKEEIKEEEAPVEIKPETPEEVIPPVEKDVVKVKEDGIPYEWAVEIVKGYVPELIESSPKMVVFFCLLEESLRLGDRILVFSQSLLTLNTIENFLQSQKVPGYDYYWAKNTTYYRLDGSTTAMEREKLINEFNGNPQIHLFLVSTRAGSLGINLVGANRVIVFDASWNPCHDTQAVCRVYRYGQKKPCFVYRLVMDNCLEKKIYDRQVNKQGMSDRVVDECNPDAHLSMKEVTNLCFDNEEEKDTKDFSDCKDKYLDIVMQKVIEKHCDMLSKEPFHHESLLVDRKEKKLSQAEKRLAQRGYEMEKRAAARPAYIYNSMGTQYRVMKTSDGAIVHRPVASVRPMQAEVGEKFLGPRPGGVRPTRWIPAEVWQRQGMTAQEMTLPLDVVIPTSSGDKANIVLKAGQKVMVLKSPKGIYMQLESGKIIAIRTSLKVNQNKEKGEDSESNSLSSALSSEEVVVKPTSRSETDTPQQKVNPTSSFSSVTSLLRKESSSGAGTSHAKQNLELDSPRTQNDSSSHGAVFKSAGRPTATTHGLQQTPSAVSKPFNVQSLISNKTPSYQYKSYSSSNSKSHGNQDVITIPDLENAGQSQSSKQIFSQSSRMYNQRPQINYMSKHQPGHLIMNSPTANVKPSLSTKSNPPTITIEDDFEPPLREKVVYKPNLVDRKQRPSVSKTMPILNHPFGHKMERNIKPSHMANPSQNTTQPSERATATTDGNNIGIRQFHNVKPYNRSSNESSKTSLPQATASNSTSPMPSSRPVGHGSTGRVSSKQRMPTIRNIPAPYPSICAAQGQSSASATSSSSSSSTTVPPSTYVQQQQQQQKQQKAAQNQPETETTPPATNNYASSQYSASQPEKHAQPSNEYTSDSHSLPNKRKLNEPKDDHQLPVSVAGPTATAAATTPTMSTPATSLPVPETTPRQESTQPIKEEPTKETYSTPQSYFNPHSTPYGLPSTDPNYSYTSEHGAYHHQPQSSYGSTYSSMNPPLSSHGYSYPPAAPPHPGPSQSSYPYDSYHGHYDSHLYATSQPSSATSNYHSTTLPAASNTTQPPNQYHYPGYPPPPPPPSVSDQYNSYYGYPPYPQTGQWQQ